MVHELQDIRARCRLTHRFYERYSDSVRWVVSFLFLVSAPFVAAQNPGSPQRALVTQYCVGCHNSKTKTAGIALDKLDFANVGPAAGTWEKVLRKVRTGEMPPPGLPRPQKFAAASLSTWLEQALDSSAAANPNPGRPAIHRLNRAEYSNVVRDLLALDIKPGNLLPVDDSGYGFDNIADVLTLSPALLERYMSVARQVSSAGGWRPEDEAGRRAVSSAPRSTEQFPTPDEAGAGE